MLTDDELLAAWAHLTLREIKAQRPERGTGSGAVNAARKRVIALREKAESQ